MVTVRSLPASGLGLGGVEWDSVLPLTPRLIPQLLAWDPSGPSPPCLPGQAEADQAWAQFVPSECVCLFFVTEARA